MKNILFMMLFAVAVSIQAQEVFMDGPLLNAVRDPKPLIPSATNAFFTSDPGGNTISISSPQQLRRFTNDLGKSMFITRLEMWMTAGTYIDPTGIAIRDVSCNVLLNTNISLAGKVNNAWNGRTLATPYEITNGQIFFIQNNLAGNNESKGFAGGWNVNTCVFDVNQYTPNANFWYYTLVEAP
jgi:hypothetical protein